MFKPITKSNISKRNFQVYKEWTLNTSDNTAPPIIHAYDVPNQFDPNSDYVARSSYNPETSTFVTGSSIDRIYSSPLYNSIKAKYYSANGNVFNQYGLMENPFYYAYDRLIQNDIYVIQVPQIKYGEQIKRNSVTITDHTNNVVYVDDKWGRLKSIQDSYMFIAYDAETEIMTFVSTNYIGTETSHDVTVSQLDMDSGIGVFTYDALTNNYIVFKIDFQTNLIEMSEPLIFNGTELDQIVVGNVFYDDGLVVITRPLSGSLSGSVDYTIDYRSVHTIHETEILVSANAGEFNYSQNPSAVNVLLDSTSSFQTTAITNTSPEKTWNIKQVLDISRKPYYYGTIGSNTGSWDDYYEYQTTDPTGSYMTTYISTIGIYDNELNMVAIAKLPSPIKNLPDYDVNFLVRLDL